MGVRLTDGQTDRQTEGQKERQTDGQGETNIPPPQLRLRGGWGCHKNPYPYLKIHPRANRIHRSWFIFSLKFAPLWHLLSFAENFTPNFQTNPATSFTPVIFPFSTNNFWTLFILNNDTFYLNINMISARYSYNHIT